MTPADLFFPWETRVLVHNIFAFFFCRKSISADSRHSNGYELCSSSRRHLSVFIRSGIHIILQSLLSAWKKQLASLFNLTYRNIDDVLSINNQGFEKYLGQMYPSELEIKDTTETIASASYPNVKLLIGRDGQHHTSFNDKPDDFNFLITNFPFLSSRVVIFYLHRPIAFYLSIHMPRFALCICMNV